MSDAEIESKRQIVIDSLNFLVQERNKSLFRLSKAKIDLKSAQSEEKEARQKARNLKRRLVYELDKHLDILRPEDRRNLIGDENDSE